jgi:hypothetical protein
MKWGKKMIKSMTGFGRGEYSDGKRNVTAEIKTVNHRYSDINVKMPKRYSFAEENIKNGITVKDFYDLEVINLGMSGSLEEEAKKMFWIRHCLWFANIVMRKLVTLNNYCLANEYTVICGTGNFYMCLLMGFSSLDKK